MHIKIVKEYSESCCQLVVTDNLKADEPDNLIQIVLETNNGHKKTINFLEENV